MLFSGRVGIVVGAGIAWDALGGVSTVPVDADRSAARVLVFVPKGKRGWERKLIDPIDARVRRSFIRRFLQSSVQAPLAALKLPCGVVR